MPGFGLGEIILIIIVVIIIVRPDDLPGFIRNVGKIYATLQAMVTKWRSYMKYTMAEITKSEFPQRTGNQTIVSNGEEGASKDTATISTEENLRSGSQDNKR